MILQVGLSELGIDLNAELPLVVASVELGGGTNTSVTTTNGEWKETSSSVETTDLKTESWQMAQKHSETKTVIVTEVTQ